MRNTKLIKSGIIAIGLMVGIMSYAQPALTFTMDNYDYGTLYTDSLPDGRFTIEFVNTGDAPLILSNVTACCGTRVHEWPKNPILPNETGLINIEFRVPARPHRLSRVVTVTSNSEDSQSMRFMISGQIEER